MDQRKAYKYRICPSDEQKQVLARTFGCCRFVYNWALRQKTDAFYNKQQRLYYKDLSAMLPTLKQRYQWLGEVASVPLQQVLRHLDKAFINFFEGRGEYPKFKKRRNQQSATSIGADLGLKSFVVLSNGEDIGNPKFFRKDEKKLAKAQRRHAKKKKGSKNRAKARKKVAKIHARITDRRRDFSHKLSTRLIRENQTICVEDLAVKNMVKNHTLSKAISDVGWSEFVSQLDYKAKWYGRHLVKIDKWYPSSKRRFECGHMLDSLTLDIREWTCPECGVHHDRDINAARNIHAVGLTVFEACGEAVRPGAVKANPGKPR